MSFSDEDESEDLVDAWISGHAFSDVQASALEKVLEHDPNRWLDRLRLLGYYAQQRCDMDRNGEPNAHVVWFIKNQPDACSDIANFALTHRPMVHQGYNAMKKLWLEQIGRFPTNPTVLRNAAKFFNISDKPLAEETFRKAKLLAPRDYRVAQDLAHFYENEARFSTDVEHRQRCSREALRAFEECVELAGNEARRFYALTDLIEAAGDHFQVERTQEVAAELFELAKRYQDDWNYGNAIFYANYALAQIAFRSEDLDNAGKFLLKASQTPGSPQLDSFGPNFELAQRLLDHGDKATVREYIVNCAKFWKSGRDRCHKWLKQIETGRDVHLDKHNFYGED